MYRAWILVQVEQVGQNVLALRNAPRQAARMGFVAQIELKTFCIR